MPEEKEKPKKEKKEKKPKEEKEKKEKTKPTAKKKDSKPLKDADAVTTMILGFFERENRPYSPQDIINLSQGKLKKAAVEKGLVALVEKGECTEKVIKSTRAFMANQNKFEVHDEETARKMDNQITELTTEAKALEEEVRSLQKTVSNFNSQLTDDQLKTEIKRLKQLTANKAEKLQKLQSGTVLVTEEDKEKAVLKYCTARGLWKKRKRLANDMIDEMCGDVKNPKDLRADVGIETDEEAKVTLAMTELDVQPKPQPKPAKVQKTRKK